jgi:parvulin-like peptidyl-prolyl isomerase
MIQRINTVKYLFLVGFLPTVLLGTSCDKEVLPQADPVTIQPASDTGRAKVRHLLLSYEGAWRADTRRTKENARVQTEAYLEMIQNGADFGYLAQQFSEDTQKKDGGLIGVVEQGQMVKEFEEALFALDLNETSTIVETGFGFHILQRLPLDERLLIHIEVDTKGTRDIVSIKLQEGLDPRLLAREHSIAPHGLRGGELGWFEKEDLDTVFTTPVFALEIGTCSEPIERSETWHFFCRQG